MPFSLKGVLFLLAVVFVAVFVLAYQAAGQSSSGTIQGTVTDPSGAVVPGAHVEISDPVSGLHREAVTGSSGEFRLVNVPFNPYHMVVKAGKFAPYTQDVEVRSMVPVTLEIKLNIEAASTSVTVEGAADLIETDPTFHTDVDRGLFDKLPLESTSSSVSALVTQTSPGIAADSNGLFHGLGDHAENSFSVDGQPITDQQSKVFSNQIPLDSIESLEVIDGAPPAEYGDKTSVVINVTTRSGMGQSTPKGSFTTSYGSFGTSSAGFDVAYGGQKWGNFISVSGLNTSRFLDPPEAVAIHDRGNQENFFNRLDFQPSAADTIHFNLGFTRSWFQTPNAFDNLNLTDQFGNPVGSSDQRSQIRTFNLAPSWTHLINANTVFTFGLFARHDEYNYYPSGNPFADNTPLQQETIGQTRMLTNLGARSDVSYVKGMNNVKVGVTYQQTLLRENDQLGIVDPNFLGSISPSCLDALGNPLPGTECATLAPFDLTRGGGLFSFVGRADVKELALYAQDTISKGPWTFNVGLRGDIYNGLTSHNEAEPRLGISYNIKPSSTVLRVSNARVLETPFNENLVLSDIGCTSAVLAPLLLCSPGVSGTLSPGWRNEFHAGLQQAFGKYLVFSGEYIWKYTHNGYDFSVLGATPITFPIEWHNSKITGLAGRVSVPNFHHFSAQFVFGSVAARFFPPQIGGAGATVGQNGLPFRIDHDEKFNQTTHLQYQVGNRGPWLGFNWRYDSGLVAGAVPFAADTTTPVDLTGLTADQQMQAGLFCGNVFPTLTAPLTTCAPNLFGSTRITIPAPGTENDDKNPPRIAPRSLFDASIGHDNLFNGDRYKWSLRFTAINFTNKTALYNFLSTFSGTHFVTPRTETVELGFHF